MLIFPTGGRCIQFQVTDSKIYFYFTNLSIAYIVDETVSYNFHVCFLISPAYIIVSLPLWRYPLSRAVFNA